MSAQNNASLSNKEAVSKGIGALAAPARQRRSDKGVVAWHARHYCRAVYAFPDFKHLITDGALLYKKVEGKVVDVEELSVHNQVIFYAYSYLVDNEELFDSLWAGEGKETDDQAFEKNCQLMQDAAKQARGDDTHLLKVCLPDILRAVYGDFEPPLDRYDRTARGFNHNLTGYLLCPAGRDWYNPATQAALKSFDLKLGGTRWPNVLFAKKPYTYDPLNPFGDICRSKEYVAAVKVIFTTPSSVFNTNSRGNASGRHGNAAIHGMTSMTPAAIAYVAMQLYFSLTSAAVFNGEDPIWQPYSLYLSLLVLFRTPEFSKEVEDLIAFLDGEVFPWAREPKLKLGEVDPEDEFEPFNQLSKVVASRKKAIKDSTDPADEDDEPGSDALPSRPGSDGTRTPSDSPLIPGGEAFALMNAAIVSRGGAPPTGLASGSAATPSASATTSRAALTPATSSAAAANLDPRSMSGLGLGQTSQSRKRPAKSQKSAGTKKRRY